MMNAYYILACVFGGSAALISAYAIWVRKDQTDFPGKLYVPMILLALIFAVATFTTVWIGGEEHLDHLEEEKRLEHEGRGGEEVEGGDSGEAEKAETASVTAK
ncbi:MAG: hypothetical protein WAP35_03790 [Solirubrobacterales bacterium]